jgi:hypothetical protein
MNRLAVAMTRLYPAGWRERYGPEFAALLQQCPATPRVVLNTAAGAAGAWLRWPATAGSASARLRGALTAVLWGGLAVLFAAAGFVKAEIPAGHASVRVVGAAMVAVAVVAAAVLAAGAIAPALAVARRAVAERRRDVLRLIAAPPLAGVVFFGTVLVLVHVRAPAQISPAVGHPLFYVASAAFLVATVITGRAPVLALRRLDPGTRVLRASLPFGVLAVAAMAAVTGLMTAYTIMLDAYEPWLAHSGYGPPGPHPALLVQLVGTVAVMGGGTLLAAAGLVQGTRSRPPVAHSPAEDGPAAGPAASAAPQPTS